MKPMRLFTRINLTFLVLAALLAGTLLFSGCTTTDGSNGDTADHSGQSGSCH